MPGQAGANGTDRLPHVPMRMTGAHLDQMERKLVRNGKMYRTKPGRILLATVAVLGLAGAAGADVYGGPGVGSGWSIFGPVHGSGWDINHDGVNDIGGWSIFGPVHGSGWDINHDGVNDIGGWSIFGPVSGSGWSIFGPVHGSGWSIFGPVNGSGWNIDCLFNCSGNFDLPTAVRSGVPVLVAKPPVAVMPARPAGPALVAVHCTFSEDVMLLAKSVDDCEAAGGEVDEALKAASDAASGGSGSDSGN